MKNTDSKDKTERKRTRRNARKHPYVRRVVEIIGLTPLSRLPDLTIQGIAAKMGVSLPHLSRVFKTQCGFTIRELLVGHKMYIAKQMLDSDRTIKEIAYALGFESVNSFTRTFKRYCRFSPAKYRECLPVFKWARNVRLGPINE